MSATKNIGTIVAVALTLFIIVLGSILLFGLYGATATKQSLIIFQTIYFAFIFLILGTVYIMSIASIRTWIEHLLIIFSIIIVAGGFAIAAGGVKTAHDVQQSMTDLTQIQALNDYNAQYVKMLSDRASAIKTDNNNIEANIANLTSKIENKTPVVVETVVTLPPEIIYVPEYTPVAAPIYHEDDGVGREIDD